jgi:small subunit ribosomal protein S1
VSMYVLMSAVNPRRVLRAGDIVDGNVRGVASFGAFIDLGGAEGLLHFADVPVPRPYAAFRVGDRVLVRILAVGTDAVSLGLP